MPPSQEAFLLSLHRRGAHSAERAIMLDTTTGQHAARLASAGLVDRRQVRRAGVKWTTCWLTAAGAAKALELASELEPS